jgi:hypothetical protein
MHPTKINRLKALQNLSPHETNRYERDEQQTPWYKKMFNKHPYNTHSSNQIHALMKHSVGCTCYYCDR